MVASICRLTHLLRLIVTDYNLGELKYCKDEAVDYDWLIQYKKNYPLQEKQQESSQDAFIPITIKDVAPKPTIWQVETLILKSPDGEQIEIKSNSLFVVAELLHKMSQP